MVTTLYGGDRYVVAITLAWRNLCSIFAALRRRSSSTSTWLASTTRIGKASIGILSMRAGGKICAVCSGTLRGTRTYGRTPRRQRHRGMPLVWKIAAARVVWILVTAAAVAVVPVWVARTAMRMAERVDEVKAVGGRRCDATFYFS